MPKTKAPSLNLCKRFENGLDEKYGMSKEDLITENWKNCGGNQSSYKKYYKMCFPKTKLPEPVDKCVCGTIITQLHYITPNNKSAILTIGKCCKAHFMRKEVCGRTCEKCREPHRNTKDNLCKKCRPKPGKTCEKCGESHKNRSDNRCNSCRLKWRKCKDCDKEIQDYLRCFNCNKSYQKEKRN